MATSSFYFSFGMGQRLAAESVEAGQEVGNKPKMGKKFSHVVSEVDAHRFDASFSREKCRGFLKSRSVSRESCFGPALPVPLSVAKGHFSVSRSNFRKTSCKLKVTGDKQVSSGVIQGQTQT